MADETKNWGAAVGIIVTIILSLVAGSMRFASMEARVTTLEGAAAVNTGKLDNIEAALARIEGRLDEAREERDHPKR